MIFLVLESHRALHFGGGVDEGAQRITGQTMVIAAGVDVLEFLRLEVAALGVYTLEQEALDLIGGVERVVVLLVQLIGKSLEKAADIGVVRSSAFVDHITEDQHLAGAEHVRRSPIKGCPVDSQAQVAFALGGEATNRRTVK